MADITHFPSYKPPILLHHAHLQTMYPSLFRKIDSSFYKRERISTADNDFLDLDWARTGSKKLAIISHGLEGSSQRSYMIGMSRTLNENRWDALAWNFRSCSGEINRQLRFYHSGTTDDLETVVKHAVNTGQYNEICLVGFSMGGNQILLYLGQQGECVPNLIHKAVVFSVPCDLYSSSEKLAKWSNKIYMRRFIKMLHDKIKQKMKLFPGQINDFDYYKIKNFKHFDDRYTAPINGFKNAEDYWTKCSSKPFIKNISIPTLIVNALNDPFLAEPCYPFDEVKKNENVTLETPEYGGHVGFASFGSKHSYWSEKRAVAFFSE